jgi:hypothetical protein
MFKLIKLAANVFLANCHSVGREMKEKNMKTFKKCDNKPFNSTGKAKEPHQAVLIHFFSTSADNVAIAFTFDET